MARVPVVGITAGVPDTGTGDVPTLETLIAPVPVTGTFTPGAALHGALDCVGAAATFSSIGLSGARMRLTRVQFQIATGTATTTAYNLVLLKADLATPVADNGVFSMAVGDRSNYIETIYIPQPVLMPGSAFQSITLNGLNIDFALSGTSLVGYLVAISSVTFAAVAHEVTLHCYPLGS